MNIADAERSHLSPESLERKKYNIKLAKERSLVYLYLGLIKFLV